MAATRKLDASQLSGQALARGQAGIQRAQEFAGAGADFRQELSESRRQFDLQRWDQQWERTRAERAQRDEARAKIQAGKADTTIFGGKGRKEREEARRGDQIAAEAAAERKGELEAVVSEKEKDRELEAAKAGLKRGEAVDPAVRDRPPVKGGPPGRKIHEIQGTTGRSEFRTGEDPRDLPGGAAGAPVPQRTMDLRQEMDQQGLRRAETQMGQALESTGAGGWVSDPTSPVTQAAGAKAAASAFDQRAKRERHAMELTRAAATYKANKTKENKIEYERSRETNMIELAKWTNALKRIDEAGLQSGEQSGSLTDWNVFRKAAANLPNVGKIPIGVHDAIKTRIPNPEFIDWAVQGQGKLGLLYIAIGQGLPDREYITLGSKFMLMFVNKIQELKAIAKTQMGGPNGLQTVKTLEALENIEYAISAKSILEKMPTAPAAPAQAGGGGAEAGAQPEPGAQPQAGAQPEQGMPLAGGAAWMGQGGLNVEPEVRAAAGPQPAPGVAPEEFEGPPEATRGEQGTPGRTKISRTPSPEEVGMERPRTDEEWAEYMRRLDEYPPLQAARPKAEAPEPGEPEERKDVKVPEQEKQPKKKAKAKPKPKKKKRGSSAVKDIKVPK